MKMKLFTIGHSNHSIETFIALLQQHQITALADVRSHPYSRYLPHFSQAPLRAALAQANMQYVFLGRELGARRCCARPVVDFFERLASRAFQKNQQQI
jgi:uncharacterized protein (DUF488 family)